MRVTVAAMLVVATTAGVPHHPLPIPPGWGTASEAVSADHIVDVHLSLKQSNLNKVFEIARSVSDPDSKAYGQYLTSSQLAKLTAPKDAHKSVVENWLKNAGSPFKQISSNILQARMKVGVAASLFKTNFQHVVNPGTGQKVVQASTYELPEDVNDAIASVYGMHGFPMPRRMQQLKYPDVAEVTPAVIAQTYDVAGVKPSGSQKNRQAVPEFMDQTVNMTDLATFFSRYVPDAPASDAHIFKYVNAPGIGKDGVESGLDVEYMMGVAPGVLTEYWYWKGDNFCQDLHNYTSKLLSTDDAPLVHSISYGLQANVSHIGCKIDGILDTDVNFAKLAAKGVTIIFASGDSGSGYDPQIEFEKQHLYPAWPASSPWVTAVGSTRFQGQKVGNQEQATDLFGSGGGFSSMFDPFDAQKAAVANYFKVAKTLPPSGTYAAGGRATPDVAALGEGFQILQNGNTTVVGGTSAAAPTFAGLVSLLNEARLKAGKPAMGYLNPWLYKNPSAFTDITVGNSSVGRYGESLGKHGWLCAKGWDPVTGLGTPIFSKMLAAAMVNTSATIVV
jgi:tripeptidyl-peptidase-1